ncbi:MAG: aminotransferase class III-fold pyridoxal phosphate-dependent enzyme, partial [Pseudomonadota bacterium]
IGGGFPLAALAGRADIMAHFDKAAVGPDGWLMQTGTLSGNPVAAAAGLKTLEILRRPGKFEHLRDLGRTVAEMIETALNAQGIAHRIVGDDTLFDVVFTDREVRDYRDTHAADRARAAKFTLALRDHGVFKSAGKTYPNLALTEADFEITKTALDAAARVLV